MNAGVTSLTALMAKSDLDGEAYVTQHGEDAYVELIAAYSLAVGIASILLALLGFGGLAALVPKQVRSGFKWGCALGVLVSALPNGLLAAGSKELKQTIQMQSETFQTIVTSLKGSFPGGANVTGIVFLLSHPWNWTIQTVLLFVGGTAFVMHGKQYLPKACPPGTEVVLLTAVATLYSMYGNYPGGVVGEIPSMDPDMGIVLLGGHVRIPIQFLDLQKLISTNVPELLERFGGSWLKLSITACIFSAVNFLSIVGIASSFESEEGIAWSARRELISQGASCCAAAAVGSAPVSGSLSRSLVSRMTGTTSQLACIFTAFCWIYLQPYMSIMTPCPKAALSAVIVSAVLRGVMHPKDLLAMKGTDSLIAWFTGIATATTSPTNGFGAGLACYLLITALAKPSKQKTKGD